MPDKSKSKRQHVFSKKNNNNKTRNKREASAPVLAKKLCSCIKKVYKTVKLRKGVTKTKKNYEKAAIGICVKSVVQRKEHTRTLRRFSCRKNKKLPKLITQTAILDQ